VSDDIRRVRGVRRCMALEMSGRRCAKRARWSSFYHGDPWVYSQTEVTWVRVELCKHHARAAYWVTAPRGKEG
jgi:hypothetical protein